MDNSGFLPSIHADFDTLRFIQKPPFLLRGFLNPETPCDGRLFQKSYGGLLQYPLGYVVFSKSLSSGFR